LEGVIPCPRRRECRLPERIPGLRCALLAKARSAASKGSGTTLFILTVCITPAARRREPECNEMQENARFNQVTVRNMLKWLYLRLKSGNEADLAHLTDVLKLHGFLLSMDLE
jgi:hypothetical protein